MVINNHRLNNQNAPTATGSQFLEQNITQDCNDTSHDPKINQDCCEIIKGIQEWNGNPCEWFYMCDKNNFHCILNVVKIIGFCFLILGIVIVIVGCAICFWDLIRVMLNDLLSNLPLISGRRAEANAMEMKESVE